jgi:TRAP-type C4-dicarboxylate transport system permease small subunit
LSRAGDILGRLERFGKWFEDAVLVIILVGMIGLAAGQIVLRNFFDVGFIWGDELLRMLVLWLAVGGAVAASRSDKHIHIDLLNRYLPRRAAMLVTIVVHVFTAGVCGVVAWASLAFVQTSREFGDVLLGEVPAWILQAVLPIGFALITWRYALFALAGIGSLFRRGAEDRPA